MELVGCVCSVRMAGRWWWRRRVHHLRIHKYTHTRIHISYAYIYPTCVCTVLVCDTDTKGPKGELRPTFVQPRFLPQGHRCIVYVRVCSCQLQGHKNISWENTLQADSLSLYTYIATCIMFMCTGSVTPILYTYVNVVLAKGRNGDYIYVSVYCPTRVTLPCVEYYVGCLPIQNIVHCVLFTCIY